MPNSHITNFVNAVVNKASTLINSHNNSDDAHSSLFSSKSDTDHSHSYANLTNKPTIPSANATATNIKMDGTQSAGSLSTFAKADHVHPTDTSRAAATHSHTKSEITDFPTSMTPSSHTHGNITNDGKVGTAANKPLITTTNGVVTTGSFGTAANTFCQGNDSRLSDTRNPKINAIPNDTTTKDLNNYITPGFYYCNNNSYAPYITNVPIQQAGYLIVESWGATNNIKQTWTTYYQTHPHPRMFYRVRNGANAWSPWKEIQTHDEQSQHFIAQQSYTGDGTFKAIPLQEGYVINNKTDWTIEGEIMVTGSKCRFQLQEQNRTDANNHLSIGKNTGGYFATWYSTSASAESGPQDTTVTFNNNTWYPFTIMRRGNVTIWYFNNSKWQSVLTTYFNTLTYITPQIVSWGTDTVNVRNVHIYANEYKPIQDVTVDMDYNDYKKEGRYFIWASHQVNNTNAPDTQGGLLVVQPTANGVMQTLYQYYMEKPKIFYRIWHNTAGWRNWQTISVDGHTHTKSQITDFPTSMTPTTHAATTTTYGASSASNYGHAMASSTSPKANGTAAVGSETAKFARGDHVHPHNCVNNLTSTSTTAPLAANQGKVLKNSLTWTQVAQPVTGITLYANDYLCMCVINYDSASVAINTEKLDSNADAFPSAYRPPQRVAVPNTYGSDANSYSIDVFVDTDGFVKTRSVRAWSSINVKAVLMWGRI